MENGSISEGQSQTVWGRYVECGEYGKENGRRRKSMSPFIK